MDDALGDGLWHQTEEVKRYAQGKSYGIAQICDSIVDLLSWGGVVETQGSAIRLSESGRRIAADLEPSPNSYWRLIEALLRAIARDRLIAKTFGAIRYAEVDHERRIELRLTDVPIELLPITSLFTNLSLFHQGPVQNSLLVQAEYAKSFGALISCLLEEEVSAVGPTEEELKSSLTRKGEAGEAAEEFVLALERRRLVDHPNREQIRRISTENVAAGYDIRSFSSLEALLCDRLIEVKGYSGEREFFWTANEVEVARKNRDRYLICLVDVTRIHDSGYEPITLNDPFRLLFGSKLPRVHRANECSATVQVWRIRLD